MSVGEARESVVMRIAAERPWLLLILVRLLDMGGGTFTVRDVAEPLGLRSYVVERGLWWLKKYGFVEEVPGTVPRRYRLKSVEDPKIVDLRTYRWICGNTTVIQLGDIYVVLINRGEEVIARTIHRNIVEAVREAIERHGIARDVKELSRFTGLQPPVVATALRVLDTLVCRREQREKQ